MCVVVEGTENFISVKYLEKLTKGIIYRQGLQHQSAGKKGAIRTSPKISVETKDSASTDSTAKTKTKKTLKGH